MRKIIFLCFIGLFLLSAANAWASPFDFDLGFGNSAISGYAGPYASVNVDLNASGDTATITFDSYSNESYMYYMGATGAAAVNVNCDPSDYAVTNITPSVDFADGGSGQESGFGKFNQTIDGKDASFKDITTQIIFDLVRTTGTWGSAGEVLKTNLNGNLAAAHILVWDDSLGKIVATGYAGDGAASVPEPSTLLLLGASLVGLAGISRKRFKKS